MPAFNPVLVALDTPDVDTARDLAKTVGNSVGGVKLGKEFFTANGPGGITRVARTGRRVFLDLKFHDIPNTVAGAVRSALPLAPFMLNVHASGGAAMMRAAAEAAATAGTTPGEDRPMMLAVTVLTSMDASDLEAVGQDVDTKHQVVRLALLARESGMDGVVCSPQEITALRNACGPDFKLVVPGIRPTWAATGDQKRIMTPRQAIEAGADYLVIGRPITAADDPKVAAEKIVAEITG